MNFDINIFFLSFIPLFVAIDVIGLVPIFLSLTSEMTVEQKRKLVTQATITALFVSLLFLFGGRMIFNYLGITENDFRIGGGIVLLVLAVVDLLSTGETTRRAPDLTVGVVPIGIPLIIGPAVLTTLLIIVDSYGYVAAVIALLANLLLVWFVFRNAVVVIKLLGEAGAKASAKIASILMAAIAVMMIRLGVVGMIRGQ
ncbi:MAG: MarC family protein [Bacteroidetes bacterium]|nr:MarC family protein [Bacteroidota bacterium]